MSKLSGPLLAAVIAAALALASLAGSLVFAAGLGIVILLMTLGGAASSGIPGARPAAWLASAAGVAALVWSALDGRPVLTPLAATLGPTFVVIIVAQLLRRDGRRRLTTSLTFGVATAACGVLPVMWLALRHAVGGHNAVLFGLLGVGIVSLTEMLPVSRAARRGLGVIVASGIATGVAVLTDSGTRAVPPVSAVVLAAFAGVLTAAAFAIVDRLAGDLDRAGAAQQPVTEPVSSPVLDHRPVLVTEPPTGESSGNADGSEAMAESRADAGSSHNLEVDTPPEVQDADNAPTARSDGGTMLPGLAGHGALVPLGITLPVIVSAPAVYVLGRIFVG